MKIYKSFRKQGIECDKNGNRISIKCLFCEGIMLVCKKYNTFCHSKVCLSERTTDNEKGEN